MIEKLVSIIIPVYNCKSFLEQCLVSILNQSYQKLQVIIVDDGSQDGSDEICEAFSKKDSRVLFIRQENRGVSSARNAALKLAEGEYILFVDSDDWIDPLTVETTLHIAMEQDADVVLWPYIREDEERSLPKTIFSDNCIFTGEDAKRLHRRMIGLLGDELRKPENADALCTVWGKLYRAELIHTEFVDLNEIGSYEDGLFNLSVFENVQKAFFVNKPMYHYRRRSESQTHSYNAYLFERWNCLYQYMETYIKSKSLSDDYQQALNNRIALGVLGLSLNLASYRGSFFQKVGIMDSYLNDERYRRAFRSFSTKEMPLYWKIFYGAAKKNCSSLVIILSTVIQSLR